ncbi:MAG TPA: 5-(carboxyamino)imidazole ribonucleotide synthase [Pseudonocardia sp.]|uniref:5-(carboxyamino)imidazole ribonucleotide synthase n=1 Tax=Pseudonocardia sp. TaxID=60912 RepID=UPI002BD2BDC3|nr:5-(carboxyamino)imidazole ribonucleotide synthase [Pseudonocardia sp.]HTF52592.1 5-(carboxyamino)imidazole ribonucleotide synthase [Pseudonocardia sp.]
MDSRTRTPTVGMVGAGQLARMTHQAAIALGQSLRVLAVSADDPAALVSPAVVLGAPDDAAALAEFLVGCDVVTFDHENVPTEPLASLAASAPGGGVPLRPGPKALIHAQDKLVMRERLSALGVPCPPFRAVSSMAEVAAFGAEQGWPVVLKARRGGYDGRGIWMLDDPIHAVPIVNETLGAGTPLLVEQRVRMRRELAALVARSPFGQGAAWPVVQTVQDNGICVEVIAPAPGLPAARAEAAQRLALRVADELDVVGLLAVELFEVAGGGPDGTGLLVNELAMRPHNSGHWTIEGSRTSQFEQHLRAVLDYPLGDTSPTAPVTVMANVLGGDPTPEMSLDERLHHLFARFPDAKAHLYGKAERPGRKVGHVTVLGAELKETRRRATLAADWLSRAQWRDGWQVH